MDVYYWEKIFTLFIFFFKFVFLVLESIAICGAWDIANIFCAMCIPIFLISTLVCISKFMCYLHYICYICSFRAFSSTFFFGMEGPYAVHTSSIIPDPITNNPSQIISSPSCILRWSVPEKFLILHHSLFPHTSIGDPSQLCPW